MKAGTTHGEWRWERDLGADMRKLKELETDVLVSVMEEHEYRHYEIPDLYEKDEIEGVEILRFAIRDMGIPEEAELESYRAFVGDVVGLLRREKDVVSAAGAVSAGPVRAQRASWSPSVITPPTRR